MEVNNKKITAGAIINKLANDKVITKNNGQFYATSKNIATAINKLYLEGFDFDTASAESVNCNKEILRLICSLKASQAGGRFGFAVKATTNEEKVFNVSKDLDRNCIKKFNGIISQNKLSPSLSEKTSTESKLTIEESNFKDILKKNDTFQDSLTYIENDIVKNTNFLPIEIPLCNKKPYEVYADNLSPDIKDVKKFQYLTKVDIQKNPKNIYQPFEGSLYSINNNQICGIFKTFNPNAENNSPNVSEPFFAIISNDYMRHGFSAQDRSDKGRSKALLDATFLNYFASSYKLQKSTKITLDEKVISNVDSLDPVFQYVAKKYNENLLKSNQINEAEVKNNVQQAIENKGDIPNKGINNEIMEEEIKVGSQISPTDRGSDSARSIVNSPSITSISQINLKGSLVN